MGRYCVKFVEHNSSPVNSWGWVGIVSSFSLRHVSRCFSVFPDVLFRFTCLSKVFSDFSQNDLIHSNKTVVVNFDQHIKFLAKTQQQISWGVLCSVQVFFLPEHFPKTIHPFLWYSYCNLISFLLESSKCFSQTIKSLFEPQSKNKIPA